MRLYNLVISMLVVLAGYSPAFGLTAGFTATPTSGCAPLLVSFHNTTTPTAGTTYSWDFGGSSSSTLTDPSSSFTTPGVHVVTLVATNGAAVSTYTMSITVFPQPTVNFTADDTAVCPGTPITFTSTTLGGVPGAVTCTWNWGDGSPTTSGSPISHTFPGPGYYSVTLFATNAQGCQASLIKSAYIHVYNPPVANFTWGPIAICHPPGSVTFSNASSGPPPLSYLWDFGDGSGSSSATSPSHPYSSTGTFNPTLIVTDGNGCKDTVTLGPIIVDTIHAAFTLDDTICQYSNTTFTNTSSPHSTRTWNYGDGSPTTSLLNGNHTYSSPGTYVVTLTINNGPCTETITHNIHVFAGPPASFTISPVEPCPAPVAVTYTGTGPAGTTYSWIFPGGGSGSGSPATYTHTSNGIKTVTMIATDPVTGCKDTVSLRDTIRDLHFAATASPREGCRPLTVNFGGTAYTNIPTADTYPQPVTSAVWDFADGSAPGTGIPTSHTYTAVGIYQVTVNITTANGCTTWDTLIIRVGEPPQAIFTGAPLHVCYGEHIPVVFTPTIVVGPIDEWRWNFGDGGTINYGTSPSTATHTYTLPGYFDVTLTPYYHGCPGDPYTLSNYVTIDSPKAIIIDSFLCVPRTSVQFVNASMGDDRHTWYFGDGDTSNVDTVIHNYPTLGPYTVKLITYNSRSHCTDTATMGVDMHPTVVDITPSSTAFCMYDTVRLTATASPGVSWGWVWHIYDTAMVRNVMTSESWLTDTMWTRGYHDVTVIYKDLIGCLDSAVRPHLFTVGKPFPTFTATPISGCNPLAVTFNDASIPATGTTLSSYEWHFGDGSPTASSTSSPYIHIYTAAGTYDVTEIVTDNIGCKDTINRPSYISVFQPHASFNANKLNPCLYDTVTFTNTSTGGVVGSVWDFGDGATSTLTNPTHAYTVNGSYTVRLTVTDSHGCTDVANYPAYIVASNPVANFTMSDSVSVCPPLFVSFNNLSTGATTYNWDLGDGGTSAVFAPSNMYISPGLYNVILIATNPYGCKDTVQKPINIYGYAGAFTYSPLQGCAPFAVHFTASLSNVPFITWDFSDGVTSAVSFTDTITHIYTTPGAYVPKLLLSDNTGCQSSSVGLDTIKVDALDVKFGTEPSPVCLGMDFTFHDSSTWYWSPVDTWLWTYDGQTSTSSSPSYNISTPGTYPITLTVTNGWGCTGTATSEQVIDPPPHVTASGDTTVCVGDPATLFGYGAVTYTWSPGATLSCTACNPTYATPPTETTYTVTGADAHGCKDSTTVTVKLRTHTIAHAWGDTAVCYGVPVFLHDTGGSTYEWIPGTGLSSNTIGDPIATPPYTIIYTAIARLGSCIPDTNQVTVVVYPQPTVDAGPDQRVLAGSTAQINAVGTDVATWAWTPMETLSCADCQNPVASMTMTTTYYVDVASDHGCRASDSVRILVYCDNSMVFVPNAFTPNNDGKNDVFYPRGQGMKEVKTFRVYNRWGELLFERENIALNDEQYGWDGSYKGSTPKPDVYVYIIEGVCFTGESVMIKGDVTIIR